MNGKIGRTKVSNIKQMKVLFLRQRPFFLVKVDKMAEKYL